MHPTWFVQNRMPAIPAKNLELGQSLFFFESSELSWQICGYRSLFLCGYFGHWCNIKTERQPSSGGNFFFVDVRSCFKLSHCDANGEMCFSRLWTISRSSDTIWPQSASVKYRSDSWETLDAISAQEPQTEQSSKTRPLPLMASRALISCDLPSPLTLSLQTSKRSFSQPFKEKCISEVVRIGSIIIFHPNEKPSSS